MDNPLEEEAKASQQYERRVTVGIKLHPRARDLLAAEAKHEKTTISNLGRQWLAIGYRHWKRGER